MVCEAVGEPFEQLAGSPHILKNRRRVHAAGWAWGPVGGSNATVTVLAVRGAPELG